MEKRKERIDVSVVFPCLNEERTLASCVTAAVSAIASTNLSGEVIVADNGSSDRSVEIAERLGARVIPVPQRGYGSALREGISKAQGRFIVFLDADMSYDCEDIPRFLERLQAGADIVMGSRLRGTIDPGAMPLLHRYVGTPLLTGMANLLFRCGITDLNCGMRGMTRDSFERLDLHSEGMEFASEMVIKASQARLRIDEVPIRFHADQRDRHPHLRPVRDGWRHLLIMLHFCSLWIYFLPGAALIGAGLDAALGGPPGFESWHPWPVCLTSIMATMIGTQVLLLGVTALGRVHSSKQWGTLHGMGNRILSWLVRIEKGLILGLLMILVGGGFFSWGVLVPAEENGPAEAAFFRALSLGAILSFNGLQVFTYCVFLGLFGIRVAGDDSPHA